MHMYLYARGKFEQVEMWKSLAQAAFWKWRRINNLTNKEEITMVQGALRPSVIGAYEYVFPKEALEEVCSFFGITRNKSYGFGRLGLETRHFSMRKVFGCKKVPKIILESAQEIPPTFTTEEFERGFGNCVIPGVSVHLIGIKDDKMGTIGNHHQELL